MTQGAQRSGDSAQNWPLPIALLITTLERCHLHRWLKEKKKRWQWGGDARPHFCHSYWVRLRQSVRRLRGAGQQVSYALRNRAVIETGGRAALPVQPFPTVYSVGSTVWRQSQNIDWGRSEWMFQIGAMRPWPQHRQRGCQQVVWLLIWMSHFMYQPDLALLASDGYEADLT